MEKCFYLFVILLFVFAVPVALYLILKPMFQQRKLLNGVIHYDTFMRKFVFQIGFTNEFFIKNRCKTNRLSIVWFLGGSKEKSSVFVQFFFAVPD